MTSYIEFTRGTPALVQIVWIYYCLPILTGIQFSAFSTMIIALAVNEGAYVAEIFRAGIGAVDRGQFAASYSLGMSYMRALRRIILPQAIQTAVRPGGCGAQHYAVFACYLNQSMSAPVPRCDLVLKASR